MATKIQSPIEGYTGTGEFGPLTLDFKDGEAVTEEKLSDGLRAYLKGRGYKVGTARAAKEPEAPGKDQKEGDTK